MKSFGITLALAFLSHLAQANSSFGNQVVTAVTVHDSGHLMVTLQAVSHSESCATEDRKNTVILNPASPYLKEMYSTALAAYLSGRIYQVGRYTAGLMVVRQLIPGSTQSLRL